MIYTIVILSMLIALGSVFDRLTYQNEKLILRKKMIHFLRSVRTVTFPNLHKQAIIILINFYNRHLDNKKKVKTFIKIILFSWVLTTFFNLIAILISYFSKDYLFKRDPIVKWHDILPLYNVYIVNMLFDFLTILVTITILKFIVNKNFTVAFLGLIINLIIAYSLFIFCFILTMKSFPFADKTLLKFETHTQKSLHEKYNKGTPISFTLRNIEILGLEKDFYKSYKEMGFSNKAVFYMKLENKADNEIYSELLDYRKSLKDILTLKYSSNLEYNFHIEEPGMTYTSTVITHPYLNFSYLVVASTTLIPISVIILFLIFYYISKELFLLNKKFLERILNSSIYNRKRIEEFNPGAHIGTVLGLIIVLLKGIEILIKNHT